jgi:hypothetical protein
MLRTRTRNGKPIWTAVPRDLFSPTSLKAIGRALPLLLACIARSEPTGVVHYGRIVQHADLRAWIGKGDRTTLWRYLNRLRKLSIIVVEHVTGYGFRLSLGPAAMVDNPVDNFEGGCKKATPPVAKKAPPLLQKPAGYPSQAVPQVFTEPEDAAMARSSQRLTSRRTSTLPDSTQPLAATNQALGDTQTDLPLLELLPPGDPLAPPSRRECEKAQHDAMERVLRSQRREKHPIARQLHAALGRLQKRGYQRVLVWTCDAQAIEAATAHYVALWEKDTGACPTPYKYLGDAVVGAHADRAEERANEEKARIESEERAAGIRVGARVRREP